MPNVFLADLTRYHLVVVVVVRKKALSSGDSPRGALRAVSKLSTQIWAFLKNLAFEASSSHLTTLCKTLVDLFTFFFSKMHSLSCETLISCVPLGSFREKMSKKFMSIEKCICANFEGKILNFERF